MWLGRLVQKRLVGNRTLWRVLPCLSSWLRLPRISARPKEYVVEVHAIGCGDLAVAQEMITPPVGRTARLENAALFAPGSGLNTPFALHIRREVRKCVCWRIQNTAPCESPVRP